MFSIRNSTRALSQLKRARNSKWFGFIGGILGIMLATGTGCTPYPEVPPYHFHAHQAPLASSSNSLVSEKVDP